MTTDKNTTAETGHFGRRLWRIFGPVVVAMVLAALLFLVPWSTKRPSEAKLKDAAVSLNSNVFKGQATKNAAFTDPDQRYVAFLGSSELSRFDDFHPSVLAEKYNRNYRPFLLGMPGTTSLAQYLNMQEMTTGLQRKQVVFVISQQWFTEDKKPQDDAASRYYSPLQTVNFLEQASQDDVSVYMAQRQLNQKAIQDNWTLARLLHKVSRREALTSLDRRGLAVEKRVLANEDTLFSQTSQLTDSVSYSGHWWQPFKHSSSPYESKVMRRVGQLPDRLDYQRLDRLADRIGTRSSTNNAFDIKDGFYNSQIKEKVAKLKNNQSWFEYRQSIEFADLQAVLATFAKNDTDVLFVIQPINKKWSDYTGLDRNMYEQSVAKVKHQLQTQGFDNIADLSQAGNQPHFMQDTIHIGWRGWVAADQAIAPFLQNGYHAPHYTINDRYLSTDWQRLLPTQDNLATFK